MAKQTATLPAHRPVQPVPKATSEVSDEQPVIDPGFRLVRSETLFIDRAQAVEAARVHMTLPESPTERDKEEARVNALVQRIRAGLWLPCQWATVVYKGVKYRMNGQHSSHAMLAAPDALPARVAIHLDTFEAETSAAMGVLFRQFDARFSARSKQDVAGAYHGLVPELSGVSRRKAKLGVEGVAWYQRAVEGLPVQSGDDLYEMLLQQSYHPFLKWLEKVLIHGKTRELERAAVVGAMYATFITSESGSQDFWPHVARGDLSDDADPRSVLSRDLTDSIDPERRGEPLKPAEFYHKCIKAWNAYRAGEKIRSLHVNTKKGLPEIAA